jgi:hypothetical protein
MPRLPVTGLDVRLSPPAGVEDVFLRESTYDGPLLSLALIERLARTADGETIDWSSLPVTDIEGLLIALRQQVFGDRINTDLPCPAPACGARMDVSFRLSEYLTYHRPRWPRGVVNSGDESDWYQLRDADVSFRLPSVADQVAARYSPQPVRELVRRCIQPADAPARERRRAENAMAALAPSLSHELEAQCPECGAQIAFYFDVQHFVLNELRGQAAYVYEDVHLIAQSYHWPEDAILALPLSRRLRYAELVRAERTGA